MRCPKCGYTSFDHLDACKKCGQALAEHREKYGLGSMPVMTVAAVTAAPARTPAAPSPTFSAPEEVTGEDVDFGFGLMDDVEESAPTRPSAPVAAPAVADDDFFSFESPEEPAASPKAGSPAQVAGDVSTFDFSNDDDFAEEDLDALDLDDLVSFDADIESDAPTQVEKNSRPFESPEPASPQPAPVSHPEAEVRVARRNLDKFPSLALFDALGDLPEEEPLVSSTPSEVFAREWGGAVAGDDGQLFAAPGASTASPASVASRIAASGCDLLLLLLVSLGFLVAGQVVMDGRLGLPSIDQLYLLSIPYFLIVFFLCFAYFTVCHYLWGETPGKMLLGIRVEALTDPTLSLSQAFVRSVGGLMGLLPLGLGYFVALRDENLRGWNDRLAGTWVVSCREAAGEAGAANLLAEEE